jgi:predicted metalloprotease
MKSRTLAGLAAVGGLAIVCAATFLFRDNGSDTAGPTSVVVLRDSPGDLPKALAATEVSNRDYWSTGLPEVYGKPFHDLAGGFQSKSPSSRPWTCHGQHLTYDDIKGNAFYCGGQGDDYIAYDAAFLLPRLNKTFGALAPAVVLAHEMGHAIQARAGIKAPSVVIELQADCFAGAWVANAQTSAKDQVVIDEPALDSSARAILALRDRPGTPATNPQAHGLAFDRVNAFQTGYEQGARECATFPSGNVVTTELPFQTLTELQTGGNLGFKEAVPFFNGHLNVFWPLALRKLDAGATYHRPDTAPTAGHPLPACPSDPGYDRRAASAYCVPTNTVSWATSELAQLHQRIGDMATGAVLSDGWARAAQSQAGLQTSGVDAELQRVCFTGSWVLSIASATSPVHLSPGDIDEVLFTVLTPTSPNQTREVKGTSFELTAALRRGLLSGLSACTT